MIKLYTLLNARKLVSDLLLLSLVLATNCYSSTTRDDAQDVYFRNQFGVFASEVWRYKSSFEPNDLQPVDNEYIEKNNPDYKADPKRDKPARGVLSADGRKLYVTLQGTELNPGNEVVVVDTGSEKVIKRIEVGSRPYQPVLHPGGRFIVVVNELSNYLSVIDTVIDEPVGKIPADYYGQGLVFTKDGKRAYVAIRYLDQVLVLDIEEKEQSLTGEVHIVGGFDEEAFYGKKQISPELQLELKDRGLDTASLKKVTDNGVGGINTILRARCKNCHLEAAGGFESGSIQELNFLSAIENSVPGEPFKSPLLRAVIPASVGGFGDVRTTPEFHPGGHLFDEGDPDIERIAEWIRNASNGPGIRVSNDQSHPKDLTLSSDEKYLFVGNTGTQDISVIDTEALTEVSGLFIQNVANGLVVYQDKKSNQDYLIALSMGAGFGAPKERDPYGGETWDPNNVAAQFTVLRDPETSDAYPIDQQFVMGPFEGIDGTWNFKMRDIQNDVVVFNLSEIIFPSAGDAEPLTYAVMANKYESHDSWVRYTSDTAEATTGDIKGDIPPELQRVPGSMPESIAIDGDRVFITMSGSFHLVEWQIHPEAEDPSERLTTVKSWETGYRPLGVVAGRNGPAKDKLFVMNQLGETISVIDRRKDRISTIAVGNVSPPAPYTDAERGGMIAHTTVFSSDGDTSCLHCHYRDGGDGRGWGAAEVIGQNREGHFTSGGTLGIPQMKNLFAIQPYYFEGTHLLSEGQGADITEPMSSIDFDRPIWAGDFSHIESEVPLVERKLMHEELKERVEVRKLGDEWYDLEERRAGFIKQQSERYFGKDYNLRDLFGFMGAWLGNETRLLPNPFDKQSPSFKRGKKLFNSANVMCGVCHTAPEFTNKTRELADNDRRALPILTTNTRRDASYTLVSVNRVEMVNGDPLNLDRDGDEGRVEAPEGTFTTMHLRGLFDRPPVFLHHARARSLREVLLTPNHPAARKYRFPVYMGDEEVRPGRLEVGFNETTARKPSGELDKQNQVFDTHGGTSHLTPRQIDDLENFVMGIE